MLKTKRQRNGELATAMNRLLGIAKAGPVLIEYCGKTPSGEWLWQVRQGNKYLALQGTEAQVLQSLSRL